MIDLTPLFSTFDLDHALAWLSPNSLRISVVISTTSTASLRIVVSDAGERRTAEMLYRSFRMQDVYSIPGGESVK